MASTGKPITFIVPGQAQPTAASTTRGEASALQPSSGESIKHSIKVGTTRGDGDANRIVAVPGEDVVVLHIAGGPSLTLHPENARDLLLAQSDQAKDVSGKSPNEVKTPMRLQWKGLEQGVPSRGTNRGLLGSVMLEGVDVVTGIVTDKVGEFVSSKIVEKFESQVEAGLYALDSRNLPRLKETGAPIATLSAPEVGKALLVFIHGAFSETSGTFSKLWTEHPQRVRMLFARYGDRVYALDHPTLSVSPVANAITLVRALPKNARLHLVTHSRGGLVAEILARICSDHESFRTLDASADQRQRNELRQLSTLVKERGIAVDRVVRVACPARGTLLASSRLDAYLSVFKWALTLAGVPVAPLLVDLLKAVAKQRTNAEELPGLAALMPDSALVTWVHSINSPIDGDLRVVAGDTKGDSVTSWLKTLLADSFYWTDNDLIVQTRSMYGGAPRGKGATFMLDQGGKVSHFAYFSNERTAEAIVNAVLQDEPQGFRTIGPLSAAGKSSTGVRGTPQASTTGDKPAVFVIPGICGSNLSVHGERIWLGWRLINGLSRLQYKPTTGDQVQPDGPIEMYYERLADFLSQTHEVEIFAFDWRKPMEDEAKRLGNAVAAALAARAGTGKPVRLVGHSMGGLLARTMQLESPEIWKDMMANPGGRLLMLGTPNAGSWAPMQVLSGDDSFSNILTTVGSPFKDYQARSLMAQFPGFIQLQASLLDAQFGLSKSSKWKELADEDLDRARKLGWWHNLRLQLDDQRWGVPEQRVLDQAVNLRKRLDAQLDAGLATDKDKVLMVVGKSRFTPNGYEITTEGLMYRNTPNGGDGRVTLESAQLPSVRTWSVDCEHGDLSRKVPAFAAYLELLEKGSTSLLAPAQTVSREGPPTSVAHILSRPSRARLLDQPRESEGGFYMPANEKAGKGPASSGAALQITVVNGDLTFVRQPLLLGHYRSMRLTGTESVMNNLVGRAMQKSLEMDLYPDLPGTHQIFMNTNVDPENPWQLPRPEAVIVVGLGPEGKLRSGDLVQTVRQAVIAWSHRMTETTASAPMLFEIAATLIGSGGTGIGAGQSAQLIAQAVSEANERLADTSWPLVKHLYLIELYLDRATEAWRALETQVTAAPARYLLTPFVHRGTAALRRPLDSGYRGASYDLITALTETNEQGEKLIEYTLDTKRARTEIRAQATQSALIRELVVSASNNMNQDSQIGRTLFQLLVPLDIQPFLGGSTELLLQLDGTTAGIPWELLDTNGFGGDSRPWAIRNKLLRKLLTPEFRTQVADSGADASVLVIGEPECDAKYPRLPGAREEAAAVAKCLTGANALTADRVRSLFSEDPARFGPNARTVMNTILERGWRIVHIAGHGELPKDGKPRGVVLSNGTFFGPHEIHTMPVVPELVFVNCCHLAARSPEQLQAEPQDRVQFAAGVAEELIKIGVRCVIAAGWAVDDQAAFMFATTFYEALLRDFRFIDAVALARSAAQEMGGNTWAAYQCYGDPDWFFRREGGDPQRPSKPLAEQFGGISSHRGLVLALEAIEVKSKYSKSGKDRTEQAADPAAELRYLESRFERWKDLGEVAEAFGAAWTAIGDRLLAIKWYERALAANDGTATLKASEQLANLHARMAWQWVDKARAACDKLKAKRHTEKELAAAERELHRAIGAGRKSIEKAMTMFETLVALHPTLERESLFGSAYKRLALIEAIAGRAAGEAAAIAGMKEHYENAERCGRETKDPAFFYPAMNRIAADLAMNAGRTQWKGLDGGAIAAIRQALDTVTRDNPDFWSVVGLTELRVYEAIARANLSAEAKSIGREFHQHQARVKASWMWSSVHDNASFVLSKYAARVKSADEKAAVRSLLDQLESFAGGVSV